MDFVLRRQGELVTVEVRSGAKVFDADLRGLRAIAELPRVRRRLVAYRGDRRQQTSDGIEIVPVRAFLTQVERGALFP